MGRAAEGRPPPPGQRWKQVCLPASAQLPGEERPGPQELPAGGGPLCCGGDISARHGVARLPLPRGWRSRQPPDRLSGMPAPGWPGGLLLIVFKVPCCHFLITKAIPAGDKDL